MSNHLPKLDESIRDIYSGTELMKPMLQVIRVYVWPPWDTYEDSGDDEQEYIHVLSDGKFYINSIFKLPNEMIFDGSICNRTIVKLKKYSVKLIHKKRRLTVIDVNVITRPNEIINEEQLIPIHEEIKKPISIKVYIFIYN